MASEIVSTTNPVLPSLTTSGTAPRLKAIKDGQGKMVGIAQIEMIGAENLLNVRKQEIFQHLNILKEEFHTDLIFLSILELEESFNLFVTENKQTQQLLESVFEVEFKDGVAKRPGLIMRKEPWPLLLDMV